MRVGLIVFLGWLGTSAVVLTAYNLTAYALGWRLPVVANVGIGVVVGILGCLVGAVIADWTTKRRRRL